MRAIDWKDTVDFGYWMFMKINCHKCGNTTGYTCDYPRLFGEGEIDEEMGVNKDPAKFWCGECMMKAAGGVGSIEDYCEGPKRVYEKYLKDGICKHGNAKRECLWCSKSKKRRFW